MSAPGVTHPRHATVTPFAPPENQQLPSTNTKFWGTLFHFTDKVLKTEMFREGLLKNTSYDRETWFVAFKRKILGGDIIF